MGKKFFCLNSGVFILYLLGPGLALSLGLEKTTPDFNERKLAPAIQNAQEIAKNSIILKAVQDTSANPNAKGMDNNRWSQLSSNDPLIMNLQTNSAALELKKLIKPFVSEAFVSKADGTKVALLSKTTFWNHQGKQKHDLPLKGKIWIGKLERDRSTGIHQIQISVPIFDSGQPIGSLVLGISIVKFNRFLEQIRSEPKTP